MTPANARSPSAIREHFLWGARSIVLAGTHGKTTTTSLTGWLLTHGGADPSVLVGGIARNFGPDGSSYRMGQGRDFVIEGDEYDSAFFDKTAKFLKYLPDIAVINNIEFDHADIYKDMDAVMTAFARLVRLVPRRGLLLVGGDSPAALSLVEREPAVSRVQTYGHFLPVSKQPCAQASGSPLRNAPSRIALTDASSSSFMASW